MYVVIKRVVEGYVWFIDRDGDDTLMVDSALCFDDLVSAISWLNENRNEGIAVIEAESILAS